MKYLALLRGVNVGGKNKIAMSELRTCFETLGFTRVSTYINSGNIFFEAPRANSVSLAKTCEKAIEQQFGFPVAMVVIAKPDFMRALAAAPAWWGKGERTGTRSDALFIIPPVTTEATLRALATTADSPDTFASHNPVIFWSVPMAAYNKSVVPRIIGTPMYKSLTIRSSTTTKKLAELFERTA